MDKIEVLISMGFIFLLVNDMKFIVGVIVGIFVSTKYNFVPYVNLIEMKLINFRNQLKKELKKE